MAKAKRAAAPAKKAPATKRQPARGKGKSAKKSPEDEDDEVYEVEAILEHRNNSALGDEYYVKWVGYPSTQNSWEPLGNILAPKLVQEFKDRRAQSEAEKASKPTKGSTRVGRAAAAKSSPPKPSKSPARTNTAPKSPAELISKSPARSTAKSPTKPIAMSPTKPVAKSPTKPIAKSPTRSANRSPVAKSPVTRSPVDTPKPAARQASTRNRSSKAAAKPIILKPIPMKRKSVGRKSITGLIPKTRGAPKATASAATGSATVTKLSRKDEKKYILKEDEPLVLSDVNNLKVIDNSTIEKSLTFQGVYRDKPIIIKLDKTVIQEDPMMEALEDPKTNIMTQFINDVYSEHSISPPIGTADSLTGLKATVVYPANETAIKKYSRTEKILFSETADLYNQVVEPWIIQKLDQEKDYNQWVYNILDGKSEKNRVVLNDSDQDKGFMLVKDLKSIDDSCIKLLAIPHRLDLKSLRDLNEEHLPLLRNILEKGSKTIKQKFIKGKSGNVRAFIHYHPSFYFFHVHFEVIDPNYYHCSDRDNLLEKVINNIELLPDYYQRATLTYPLPINGDLFQEIERSQTESDSGTDAF